MLNVDLSESEEVSRLKTEVFGPSNSELRTQNSELKTQNFFICPACRAQLASRLNQFVSPLNRFRCTPSAPKDLPHSHFHALANLNERCPLGMRVADLLVHHRTNASHEG